MLQPVFCQEGDTNLLARNTIYIDFASEGPIYFVNFGRLLIQSKKAYYTYRLGFSFLENKIAFPLGINIITGRQNSHLEFNLTIIPCVKRYKIILDSAYLFDKYFYVVPGFGYRYQNLKGGIFIKAIISPMIYFDPRASNFWKMDPKLKFIGSLGLGYSF